MSILVPHIESERLILRLPIADDASGILRFYRENAAHLAPYEPLKPDTFYEPFYWEARIRAVREEYRHDRAMRCFLFRRDDPDTPIGAVNFSGFMRGAAHYCNLGYSVAASAEGRGYMSEILPVACAFVFDELRFHRIQANYMPHNVRSGKLLRRLGFVVEGYARDYLMIAGRWEDHVLTSLTNPRWAPADAP